jgi:hypothetical protein
MFLGCLRWGQEEELVEDDGGGSEYVDEINDDSQ